MTEPPEHIEFGLLNILGSLEALSEAERESLLADVNPALQNLFGELLALTEAERQTLRAEIGKRHLEEESFRDEAELPAASYDLRLGKVEKFLLWYVSHFYSLHTRNCAIETYYRYYHALSLRRTGNLRKLMNDDPAYNSLQGSFTRAIKSLKAKGLIETFKVKPSLWFADRGRGPEPATKRDERYYLGELEVGYGDAERPVRVFNHRCCVRNRLAYRLTFEGLRVATSMKEAGTLKDPYDEERVLWLRASGISDDVIKSVMSQRGR